MRTFVIEVRAFHVDENRFDVEMFVAQRMSESCCWYR